MEIKETSTPIQMVWKSTEIAEANVFTEVGFEMFRLIPLVNKTLDGVTDTGILLHSYMTEQPGQSLRSAMRLATAKNLHKQLGKMIAEL